MCSRKKNRQIQTLEHPVFLCGTHCKRNIQAIFRREKGGGRKRHFCLFLYSSSWASVLQICHKSASFPFSSLSFSRRAFSQVMRDEKNGVAFAPACVIFFSGISWGNSKSLKYPFLAKYETVKNTIMIC